MRQQCRILTNGDYYTKKLWKIDDRFFISEIGSIESKYSETFVSNLRVRDVAFADAVKDIGKTFGYDISYNKDTGFEIK